MITYQQALDIILKHARPLATQLLPISQSLGKICAEDCFGAEAIPPFDNSAMDGFAVCADDIKNASPEKPVKLRVAGSTVAGDTPSEGVRIGVKTEARNSAWEIMTGAAMPEAYDTVVMIEHVTITQRDINKVATEISISSAHPVGNNIRLAGEDFQSGDLLIKAGSRITAEHIAALASLGIETIKVYAQARVSILSTGKELIEKGRLKPGQIRNSNGPYLFAALQNPQTLAMLAGSIPDIPEKFEQFVTDCSTHSDIIISTGAVSAGTHDFIPQSLKKLGANILFHKVSIRPGKPILFAQLPNGTFYFGLPGNPVSAAVGLRFFVVPLLRAMQCLAIEKYPYAHLNSNHKKKSDLRFFQKARVDIDNTGLCKITILAGQESFKIKPLLYANAWAILPEGSAEISANTKIQFAPLSGEQLILNPPAE